MNLILHQLYVTCYRKIFIYQIPCGGQVRTKKFLNKSFITVEHITITVKYKKVGQTFCISLPPLCLKTELGWTEYYKPEYTKASKREFLPPSSKVHVSVCFFNWLWGLVPILFMGKLNKQNTNWYCFRYLHSRLRTTLR